MSDQLSLASLESLYTFDPAEIGPFLHAHPFLVPLLEEAHAHLREFFPDADLRLDYAYPDSEAKTLRLAITTALGMPAAIDQLDAFDYGWWLAAAPAAQGLLMIDTEFN